MGSLLRLFGYTPEISIFAVSFSKNTRYCMRGITRSTKGMAVKPEDIQLSQEQKRLVAEQANRNGKPWQSVLQEALDSNGVTDQPVWPE